MEKVQKQVKSVSLWELFFTFFKVGAFTFGGGYAMISLLEEELIAKKKWITEQDMLDMLVIAESTPGVIAVNTATSVGYKMRGFVGALMATLGVVLPSFLIIFALSFVISAFKENTWYKAAFNGVRACVMVLIVKAFTNLAKQLKVGWFSLTLLATTFFVVTFLGFDAIYCILIGAVLGIVYTCVVDIANKKKNRPFLSGEQLTNEFSVNETEIQNSEESKTSEIARGKDCGDPSKSENDSKENKI